MTRLCTALVLMLTGCAACAFPTSSNVIPTADMLERGALRLEAENDGAPRLLGPGAESYALSEYGATARLELGIDLYSAGEENSLLVNAKWLAWSERARRPALAVGILEMGSGYSPTGFVVTTKDAGHGLRLHGGAATRTGMRAMLLGVELQVSRNDYLLADWASWSEGYLSAGVYREMSPGMGVNLAYGWPNLREQGGLMLLDVSYTFSLKPSGGEEAPAEAG